MPTEDIIAMVEGYELRLRELEQQVRTLKEKLAEAKELLIQSEPLRDLTFTQAIRWRERRFDLIDYGGRA